MSIVKWKDFNELLSVKDEVNRLLDKMFESASFHSLEERFSLISSGVSTPQFNTFYRGDDLVIQSHMPEFEKGDVKVSVSGNLLAIGSEVRREREYVGNEAYRYQRSQGSFCKVMELPAGLDTNKIKSSFTNGVLEIVIPKAGQVVMERSNSPAIDVTPANEVTLKPTTFNTLPARANEKP
jgi:HSP20 family protein